MKKTAEEILGMSFYPHECGGMIECVTKQDAIKAMEAYANQSRWISVNTPPKKKGFYICYNGTDIFTGLFGANEKWWYEGRIDNKVSYYQSLPTAPREEEQ